MAMLATVSRRKVRNGAFSGWRWQAGVALLVRRRGLAALASSGVTMPLFSCRGFWHCCCLPPRLWREDGVITVTSACNALVVLRSWARLRYDLATRCGAGNGPAGGSLRVTSACWCVTTLPLHAIWPPGPSLIRGSSFTNALWTVDRFCCPGLTLPAFL